MKWWGEEDSNLRNRKITDLQSAPFGRSGISPKHFRFTLIIISYKWVFPLKKELFVYRQ